MHDYQISWDYVLDEKISKKDLKLLKNINKKIKKNIIPTLNSFEDFKIEPIIFETAELLGVYCCGTQSMPIIGVDLENIKIDCQAGGLDFIEEVKVTILHEIKHALQEYKGFEGEEAEEEEAEDFAYNNLELLDK